MKRFMQMLLASFGVMALMLAGCSSTETTVEDGDADDTVTDESAVDATVETGTTTDAGTVDAVK